MKRNLGETGDAGWTLRLMAGECCAQLHLQSGEKDFGRSVQNQASAYRACPDVTALSQRTLTCPEKPLMLRRMIGAAA